MAIVSRTLVWRVRSSSRQLVRELGFMGQTLAGTDLHASAVHALIEIGAAEGLTARDLGDRLLLEKSTISRLLKSLKDRGEITDARAGDDARVKHLTLTDQGARTLGTIVAFANSRVADALTVMNKAQQQQVAVALNAYASALAQRRHAASGASAEKQVAVSAGYVPGLIGAIAELHGTYYAREAGFSASFEATVAQGLAEFVPRLGHASNQIWHVHLHGDFQGSIAIDGEDLGEGIAHLRWFIVSDAVRGAGIGRALLEHALNFCDRQGFGETHLWTFKGLDAARRLYEKNGFSLAEEYWGEQWGTKVREQRFVRPSGRGH